MSFSAGDYRILLEFEYAKQIQGKSVLEFTDSADQHISSELQLELLGVDMEIRLKLGDPVSIESYLYEFPHLCDRIPRLFSEVKANFLDTFCPLKDRMGEFPFKFASCEIYAELGRGGMGVVYAARDLETKKEVAIKVLFLKRELIHEEAAALQRAEHENACKVHEVGVFEGLPFMRMQRVDGSSLKEMLKSEIRLSPFRASKIVNKVARGMAKAHHCGLVHYDLKLSNILIGSNDHPYITDFGLAVVSKDNERVPWDVIGSPAYMAPEFFDSGFGRPGIPSDIYSLGVVLFQLLTGVKPFRGTIKDLVDQICNYPPSRPSDFPNVAVDSVLEGICLKAMSKIASNRFESMADFELSLACWEEQQSSSAA